jgi:hypothetical protein
MRNEYELKLEAQQKETQEIVTMIENKMRREMETVSQRLAQEAKAARTQLLDRDESSRRMLQENSRLGEVIRDLKSQLLQLEAQVTSLND